MVLGSPAVLGPPLKFLSIGPPPSPRHNKKREVGGLSVQLALCVNPPKCPILQENSLKTLHVQ